MPVMHAPTHGGRAAIVGWGLAAAASAVLVWAAAGLEIDIQAVAPDGGARGVASEAAGVRIAPVQPIAPLSIGAYAATLERPLFEATRRPRPDAPQPDAQPEAQSVDAALTPAEELRIVGIMRARKGSSSARVLVRAADAQQAIWVEAGASIGGWTVSAIGDRTITVEGGGQRREISLFQTPVPSPASAAN